MKKTILATALIFAAVAVQGQETTTKTANPSVFYIYSGGLPSQFGIRWEENDKIKTGTYVSIAVNFAYGVFGYEEGSFEEDLNGYIGEVSLRSYLSKNRAWEGFYYENALSYGKFEYEEDVYGRYSYFSFFAPTFGYKLMLGPVAIDPYLGAMWRIEIKGKGFVDNNNTDEWVPRLGIRLGYQF